MHRVSFGSYIDLEVTSVNLTMKIMETLALTKFKRHKRAPPDSVCLVLWEVGLGMEKYSGHAAFVL